MQEKDIIEKLNMLKGVQPEEKWVIETRSEVLSKIPVFSDLDHILPKKSMFGFDFNFFSINKLAFSVTAFIFVILSGFSVVYVSNNSLPGDAFYSVKMATETVELAIAPKDNKAEIAIKQAGKRLEEIKRISEKPSDINQGEKLKQLVTSFEEKVNTAQDGLIKIENYDLKAKTARVINIQTEKYDDILVKTKENLSMVIKKDVSENLASAVDSNKKVNLSSLAVRVEVMTDKDKDEIVAIVKDKEKQEVELTKEVNISNEADLVSQKDGSVSETNQDITQENISDTDTNSKQQQDLDSGNVKDDEKDSTIDETKKELLNILDNLDDNSNENGIIPVIVDEVKTGEKIGVEENEIDNNKVKNIESSESINSEELVPVDINTKTDK